MGQASDDQLHKSIKKLIFPYFFIHDIYLSTRTLAARQRHMQFQLSRKLHAI